MPLTVPWRAFFSVIAVTAVTAAGISSFEESSLPLVTAGVSAGLALLARSRPQLRFRAFLWAFALSVGCASLLVVEAGLRLDRETSVGHVVRVTAFDVTRSYPMLNHVVAEECPRFRWRANATRNSDGYGESHLGKGGSFNAIVVGDSVATFGLSQLLTSSLDAAGFQGKVFDTTMGGYDQRDEECVIDNVLARNSPSLVLVSLCLNDFVEDRLNLDIGAGRRAYFWGGRFDERVRLQRWVPLLLESNSRWVEANRRWLGETYGSEVKYDLADASLFERAVSHSQFSRDGYAALGRSAEKLRRSGVPTVFLMFPLNYPHTEVADAAHRRIAETLARTGSMLVDVRPVFAGISSDDLRPAPGTSPPGEPEVYDIIHFSPEALTLAAHAALEAVEARHHLPLEPARRSLRRSLSNGNPTARTLRQRLPEAD